jgi:hypothetical protein
MDYYVDNPFVDYGSIVRGDRFIGRDNDLRVVENRVIHPMEPGNLAVIGEPRIGKSSLVYKAIMERKEDLVSRQRLPIWINLATFDHAPAFFRSLVTQCCDEFEELGWMSEPMSVAATRALADELSWTEGFGRIQRFFRKVRDAGIRIILVLDEFDHARILFRSDVSGFQGLRELSYRPEWRLALVTTSRRTIRDIELQSQAISTLDGIFMKHYLGMFNDQDLRGFFARLSGVGLPVDDLLKEKIRYYCGGHPMLLEMLGYRLVGDFRDVGTVDVDSAAQELEGAFLDQYDRLTELLREDGRLQSLLQLLFTSLEIPRPLVVDLELYGLVNQTKEGPYSTFSEHFRLFLQMMARQSDLWPLLRETEVALRALIQSRLTEKYAPRNWVSGLEKAKPKLKETIFDRCRQMQEKEQKTFGSRASANLLDFTYPGDLFTIIHSEWDAFQAVFGMDRSQWLLRGALISRIRNPCAHLREDVVQDHEKIIVEGYCREILAAVKKASVKE